MGSEVSHAGVKGMKWRQTNPQSWLPQQPTNTSWTPNPTSRPNTSKTSWTTNPATKALNRAKMAKLASWIKTNPPIMQRKFTSVSDKTLNPEQRQAVDDFLKRQGITR